MVKMTWGICSLSTLRKAMSRLSLCRERAGCHLRRHQLHRAEAAAAGALHPACFL